MEPRKLKALLRTLAEFGVTTYRQGDLSVQFGSAPLLVPERDVEGDMADEGLRLPPGVLDAQGALERIRRAYQPKARAAS